MPALILAFDGGLANTLPLRAHALADACAAEQASRPLDEVRTCLPGRTMLEAALALFPAEAASDPTLPELIGLRAQRGFRHLVQHGVPMRPVALRALHDASARGSRLVLRADSERRDVESLLSMAGVEHLFTIVRCGDDGPRGPERSLWRSWQVIGARLDAMRLGVPERSAWETSDETASVARAHAAVVHVAPDSD